MILDHRDCCLCAKGHKHDFRARWLGHESEHDLILGNLKKACRTVKNHLPGTACLDNQLMNKSDGHQALRSSLARQVCTVRTLGVVSCAQRAHMECISQTHISLV